MRIAVMGGLMFIDIEIAEGLDAFLAAGTIFPPVNASVFPDAVETIWSWSSVDMITFWHLSSLSK
jgi:hypothetical protein